MERRATRLSPALPTSSIDSVSLIPLQDVVFGDMQSSAEKKERYSLSLSKLSFELKCLIFSLGFASFGIKKGVGIKLRTPCLYSIVFTFSRSSAEHFVFSISIF